MILHYLGLDHVGHIEGPYAPFNVRRKLYEMDEIIKKIYSSLNENDLILVLSDHGMANEGGHGGSSQMEVTTPLLFISKGLFNSKYTYMNDQEFNLLIENIKQRKQIDLVSTLSCLFGLNIPNDNRGTIFLSDLFDKFEESFRNLSIGTDCLFRNWHQLNRLLDLGGDKIVQSMIAENRTLADIENFFKDKVESKLKLENGKSDQNSYLVVLILIFFMVNIFNIFIKYYFKNKKNLKYFLQLLSVYLNNQWSGYFSSSNLNGHLKNFYNLIKTLSFIKVIKEK